MSTEREQVEALMQGIKAALYGVMCHNGHMFDPGRCDEGEIDPRWCNACGESRDQALIPLLADRENHIRAEAWDDGFDAGSTWIPSGPSGIPSDPPRNPHRSTP